MEHLPLYIPITFALTTLLTVVLLYKAGNNSKSVIIVSLLWLGLQTAIGLSGFYLISKAFPPRFALLPVPPIVFVIILFLIKKGRLFMDGFDAKALTLIHIVRIPVELTLYWLFLYKAVPGAITFEGRNFDILCGLTAPLVYYWGYIKNALSRPVLLAWNIACLLLLANVVSIAVSSAAFDFRNVTSGHPNFALFYFPFIWLPCFIVPVVLFAHVANIRKLIGGKK